MSISLPPYRPIKNRNGIQVMLAALHALIMREMQTRFGSYRLGYLWAPLEVMLQVAVFLVIFGAVMKRVLPGMDYSLFLVSGIVPFFMFQRNATRALGAVEANKGLLMYRSIRHIDIVIARCLLELIIYFFSFWLIVLVMWLFANIGFSIDNLHIILIGFFGLFLLSFGLALIMMIVGFYGKEIGKIVNIFFTILYLTSGIIYSIHIIPEPYLGYLLYNPIIHMIELMRNALSPSYPIHHIDMWYFFKWVIAVNFLGLLTYKAFEKDLIRTR